MQFFKKKAKEIHEWEFAVIGCIQQAIEVYSGGPVRLKSLSMVVCNSWDVRGGGGFRRVQVTGMIIARIPLRGSRIQHIRATVGVIKDENGRVWEPKWNEFHLELAVYGAKEWDEYHSHFYDWGLVNDFEEVLPVVHVWRQGDTEKWIGRHPGDRKLEKLHPVALGL